MNGEKDGDDPQPIAEPRHVRGERGRAVPRSAWWILALAAVLFLAFAVVRPAWFTTSPEGAPLRVPTDRHFVKTLAGLGRDGGIWLTNDVPSATFTVTLPVDSGRDVTRLKLAGSTQVAEDSTVFLMVSLDGQQVFERQLASGEHPLDAVIAIPDQFVEDGHVRIQVRARGILSDQTCTPDQSPGMVVHLDPGTVAEASLTEPLHTVRDVVAALDRRVNVVLADSGQDWLTTAAAIGMGLTRAGHQVSFTGSDDQHAMTSTILVGPEGALAERLRWNAGDDAAADDALVVGTVGKTPVLGVVATKAERVARFLTTPAVTAADGGGSLPEAVSATDLAGAEVGLAGLGTDLSEARITDTRSWRTTYSLADLPGGRIPRSVRVDMRLPATPDDLTWLLNVSLNGQLLDSRRMVRDEGVEIPLPPQVQMLDNQLTISVQRDRDLGGCDVRVASYPIQLLPSSALIFGDDPGAGFTALPRAFAPGPTVYLKTGPDQDEAALLNAVVPVLAEFTGWDRYPELRTDAAPAPGRPFVVIGTAPGVSTPIRVADGRLLAGGAPVLDLTAPSHGNVVQCATGPNGAVGLAVTPFGDPGSWHPPDFGRECAQVVTPGGNFAVVGAGDVFVATPSRGEAPR